VGSFVEVPAPSAYCRFPTGNLALSKRWARTRFTDLRYYGTPTRECPELCVTGVAWSPLAEALVDGRFVGEQFNQDVRILAGVDLEGAVDGVGVELDVSSPFRLERCRW